MDTRFDVLGIGNAIVDVITQSTDSFLKKHDLTKGSMNLINENQAQALYGDTGPGLEMSGGSAANTIVGVAAFGQSGAYFGKVADDQLGEVFRHDITHSNVSFSTPALSGGPATARSLILVTPDSERTMNTYLGACVEFGPDDVDENVVKQSAVTYMEGYLWDRDPAKEAFKKAARIARAAGRKVSLTLSDSFCVDRHRDSFMELIIADVDILFANESEIMSLYQVDTFEEAFTAVKQHCHLTALTRSEKGSMIVDGDTVVEIPALKPDALVDTTGAGDLYAAGFLAGFTAGKSVESCGRLGSLAAGEVISHYGARPQANLLDAAQREGLL